MSSVLFFRFWNLIKGFRDGYLFKSVNFILKKFHVFHFRIQAKYQKQTSIARDARLGTMPILKQVNTNHCIKFLQIPLKLQLICGAHAGLMTAAYF